MGRRCTGAFEEPVGCQRVTLSGHCLVFTPVLCDRRISMGMVL